eukprot:90606_1
MSLVQTLLDNIDMEIVVSVISVSMSVLSLFCEVFIIFTYMRFKQMRPLMCFIHSDLGHFYDMYCKWTDRYCKNLRFTERFPLYLHIAIANALRDFAKILGDIDNGSYLCQFQGFAINYGGVSTFWWIGTIGWVMYSAIFYPKVWKHNHLTSTNHDVIYLREKIMISMNYGFPFIVSLLPLFTDSYGNVGPHCWILETNKIDKIFRWLCFYIHLIIVTIYCVIIYYLIGKQVKDVEFGKLFKRIRWYPFCLIIGFGFSLIRRSIQIFVDFGIIGQILHALSTGLFGVFIFVLVGRSRGSFKLHDSLEDINDEHNNYNKQHNIDGNEDKETISGGFRAAIFGLSDGLATNLCLILGVHFALEDDKFMSNTQIMTSGIAGLFGGAISMAIGEYVSVKAQADATNAEINEHSYALKNEWNKEMELLKNQLNHILSNKTIDCIIDDLKKSKGGFNNEKQFNNVLHFYSKIVLGHDPDNTSGDLAYKSAMYSFGMFSFGALIPLSPYFWFNGNTACIMAIITSLMIAIIIGSTIGYFSRSNQKEAMQRQFFATVIGVSLSIAISKLFNG